MSAPEDVARTALDDLADLAVGWTRPLTANEREMAVGYAHDAGTAALTQLVEERDKLRRIADNAKAAATATGMALEAAEAALQRFLGLERKTYSELGEWEDAWNAAIEVARAALSKTELQDIARDIVTKHGEALDILSKDD